MATSRGKQYVRPVKIVEREPSNIAPSSPASSASSSPKVRFAPVTRELTSTEAWSLYHFECHGRACPTCYNPLRIYQNGGQLCETGHALAQDVAIHVYYKSGEIYSTEGDAYKLVLVTLPPGYDQVRGLLKGMEHRLRQLSRPVISYDQNYPVSPRGSEKQPEYREDRNEVIIEPADSRRSKPSGRKSKHKSTRYSTTVVQEDGPQPEPSTSRDPKPRERRGSLYQSDRQRKEKNYNVETREPEWERQRRKKDERRKSGFFV